MQLLDKAAFVELRDKAGVDELFGLVAADLRSPRSGDFVNRVEPFCDRIGRGNKILLEYGISAFQIFWIVGSKVFRQDLLAEIFVLLQKGDAFDIGAHDTHNRVPVFPNRFASRDDRCRRINDLFSRIEQNAKSLALCLGIRGIRQVGGIDRPV